MFKFLIFKKNTESLIAAVTGFIIIILFTKHGGIGICPDGVAYVTTAENFSTSGKLTDFTQNALVDFPLLYPFFLSLLNLITGLKPLFFAPVLNATLFAILIYLAGYVTEQFNYSTRWYKIAILSCIVLSPCLLEVYSMIWSETVFLVLLILFIISIHKYFKKYSRKILIVAASIAALAAVTRYAGVTIIVTGGLLLLMDMKLAIKRKITDIFIYSFISTILLTINLLRNFAISGTLTGMRERSLRTLSDNMAEAGSVLYNWFTFTNGLYKPAPLLIIILIAALTIVCFQQIKENKRLSGYQNIAALFSLVFVVFMLVSASLSRFEEMDSRLLSPIFIPVLWCSSSWIVTAWQKIIYDKKKWIIASAVLMFSYFQYTQLSADYETWDGVKDAGIPGYTEDQWRYSETVRFLENDFLSLKKNYTIYSNAYDAIHFFTGRIGKFLPHKEFMHDVQNFLKDEHCYMVWFTDGDNPDLVDMSFITNVKKMKLVKQFSDGAIYEYDKN